MDRQRHGSASPFETLFGFCRAMPGDAEPQARRCFDIEAEAIVRP